jgi:hypothetical protein
MQLRTIKCRHNTDLGLVHISGSFLFYPAAKVTAGETIKVASVPEEIIPAANAAGSLYRVTADTDRAWGAVDTNGEIVFRNNADLPGGVYTYFFSCTYYVEPVIGE